MKLRIAIIGLKGLPAFGGASRSMEEIIKHLSDSFDITTYEIDTHANRDFIIPNIHRKIFKTFRIHRLNTFYYYLRSAYECLVNGNYDIIITNHLYCGFIIPILRTRFRVINIVHGLIPKNDIKWNRMDILVFRVFEFFAIKFSNILITVAKPHIDYLKDHGAKNVTYIPNGVDVNFVLSIKKNVKKNNIVFSAARILKLKGCHTLFEAIPLSKYNPKVKVIGDINQVSEYRDKLIYLSKKLEVEFIDLIKDKKELFQHISNAELFVFPSFNEGMSNMLLEVAALKTPIICSDITENKAIFNENEVLYFKVGDSYDLSQKINWAYENYLEMISKAENAFHKVVNMYSWDTIAEEYKETIIELSN